MLPYFTRLGYTLPVGCLWLLAFCVFHLLKAEHVLFIATVHCSNVLLKRARERIASSLCFINQRQRTSCTRVSAIMLRASRETFSIIWFGCVVFSILFIIIFFSFSLCFSSSNHRHIGALAPSLASALVFFFVVFLNLLLRFSL